MGTTTNKEAIALKLTVAEATNGLKMKLNWLADLHRAVNLAN